MKVLFSRWFVAVLSMALLASSLFSGGLRAATWDPTATDYTGHKGKTIYVSKKGDNSDGSSWQKGFHTIQQGLAAIPDKQGGYRVIVRPDTYVEANLAPAFAGAAGSYNAMIGDFDGSLGSGRQRLDPAGFGRSGKGL